MAGLLNYGYESFEVEGDSMAETYSDGERFLVNKVAFGLLKPQVGDVIVFWSFREVDFMLKRVIAVPGDEIEVIEGCIFVNGVIYKDGLSEQRILDQINFQGYGNMAVVELRSGEYWCIGDNRDESWYGIVYEDEILGLVE